MPIDKKKLLPVQQPSSDDEDESRDLDDTLVNANARNRNEQNSRVWRASNYGSTSPGSTDKFDPEHQAKNEESSSDEELAELKDENEDDSDFSGDDSNEDKTLLPPPSPSPSTSSRPNSRGEYYRRRLDSAGSMLTRSSIVSVLGDDRRDDNLITAGQALAHLLKGMIGTGLLALPYAFSVAGIVGGPLFMAFICMMSLVAMNFLLDSNRHLCRVEKKPFMDYGELAASAFRNGPIKFLNSRAEWGKTIINILLIITQLGFCAIYFVFMAESLISVMDDFNAHEHFDTRLVICFFFIPVVLLCLIRNLALLAVFSMMANVLLFVGLAIILYALFDQFPNPSRLSSFGEFEKFPLFFGSAIFSVEGIGLVLPLENKMKKPEQFKTVLNGGMTFVFSLYILFGFLGYNKFGQSVESSISYSLPDDWYYAMTKLIFAVAMYVSFALQFLVPVRILLPWVNRRFSCGSSTLREYTFRIFLIVLTFVAAIAIPYLNLFITLLGSVASSCLALIIPAFIFELSIWSNSSMSIGAKIVSRILIFILIVVGVTGGIMGTIISVNDIIKAFTAVDATKLVDPTPSPINITIADASIFDVINEM